MNAEDRLPLIRVGLSIGVILFAFLAWLRVDWWLKGHYSFLTKLTFGIVLIIGVGLIWSGAVEWLLVM